MSKNIDGDPMNEDYADFLANTIESHKDSFSEEEYETLSKDIETIRGIEEEIAKLEKKLPHLLLPAVVPTAQLTLLVCSTVSKGKIWMVTM